MSWILRYLFTKQDERVKEKYMEEEFLASYCRGMFHNDNIQIPKFNKKFKTKKRKFTFYGLGDEKLYKLKTITENKEIYNYLKDKYDKYGHGEVAIDNNSGKFAGYFIYTFEGENRRIWLHSIYVEERFRGYGLANLFMKDAVECFLVNFASVSTDNKVALYLFEKFGFKKIDTVNLPEKTIYRMYRERRKKRNRMNEVIYGIAFNNKPCVTAIGISVLNGYTNKYLYTLYDIGRYNSLDFLYEIKLYSDEPYNIDDLKEKAKYVIESYFNSFIYGRDTKVYIINEIKRLNTTKFK